MNCYSILKAGVCVIAAPGFFTSAVFAQTPLLTLEPTSEWVLEAEPDRCRITREFGEGENQTTISLETGLLGSDINLIVTGSQVENPYSNWMRFQFGPNEKVNHRKFFAGKAPDGRSTATVPGATFAPRIEVEYGKFARDSLNKGRLGAIKTLAIKIVAARPFALNIDALDLPMMSLTKCVDERRVIFANEHREYSVHAKPTGNPGTWISSDDYPTDLLINRKGALVEFSLAIDKNGKPNFCEIKPSTRPQRIDETLCIKLLQRARFESARNNDGAAVPDVWSSRIRFEIKK